MKILTPSERRALRARAHPLRPVVAVGQHGLTPAVLHEIDVALLAHELIKIRVFSAVRGDRDALLLRICAETDAAPVQHLGRVLTVWRPNPAPEAAPQDPRPQRAARRPRRAATAGDPATSRAGTAKPPPSRVTEAPGGRRDRDARPHGKAVASRRRPSDVTSTGATAKRRPVKGGMAPEERKRAPATAKGPFEPGKRAPRTASGAGGRGEDRSRRRSAATGGKAPPSDGAARRRTAAGAGRTASGIEPPTRRRRRQP
jgi:putative YhbY family RNA-binding protein